MKIVKLKFDNTISGLAGFPYGQKIYEDQVKGVYTNHSEKIEIEFPNNIQKVASSFVQGFFSELVLEVGYEGIEKNVEIKSSSDELSKAIKKRLY
ncbi:hypothetical protein BCR22_07455 [Enterococcus plantarum]|uniref:STAS-like domain-containing protein n=1 Tax=Enterococcus plantarum TaxID=1077675 RepID=UPI00084D17C5|nr:DUF4325 domain-containing protein [Enterococcus plantarum]OEG09423.1 hypothetical protein BCR22_07455 [Enterococcus plantarum]